MYEYRVLVTGSREFTDYTMMDDALYNVWHDKIGYGADGKLVIIAGGAAGADSLAELIASQNRDVSRIEVYPAQWDKYSKAAGPIRNQQMLDTGVDLVLAFYKTGAKNRGTQDMVDRAEAEGIEVRKHYGE